MPWTRPRPFRPVFIPTLVALFVLVELHSRAEPVAYAIRGRLAEPAGAR